jgi:HlyD family secretion protein
MDRELDSKTRRSKMFKRISFAVVLLLVSSVALIWGPDWIRPSVHRSRIRTAIVDRGAIEAGLSASGIVMPEFEAVLSSPIDARVIRILKRAGAAVSAGDPIIELDISDSQLALERINQNLTLKQNKQSKTRLDLEQILIDLQGRMEIKHLELQSLSTKLNQNRRLLRDGLVSADDVRRAELEESRVKTELKQLEALRQNAELSTRSQIEGLEMETAFLEKEKKAAQSELNLATTKSNCDGVLPWVVNEEGTTIRKGDVIARIADLRSFRVDATISDRYADEIRIGIPVETRVNESTVLAGNITNILPTIQDGILTVQIALRDKTHKILRSNLRVDVEIITERKDRVLRVKKGPALSGESANEVFVIRGTAAIRTPVRLGLASFDAFEVVSGLMEGDEVIISDVGRYLHLKEFAVQ